MKSLLDSWTDLFDNSLEIYANEEDGHIRNLTMLMHVMQLQLQKTSKYIIELKQVRSPLKAIDNSKSLSETKQSTENKEHLKKNVEKNKFESIKNENSKLKENKTNILDNQLIDSNTCDESLFVDNSTDNIVTSPVLNKKKKRKKVATISKKKINFEQEETSNDETIVPNFQLSTKKVKMDLQNSYDWVPKKQETNPNYIYKEKNSKKRDERMKLQGWACVDCEQYYSTFKNLSKEELKKRMDKCSKHRSKFNPNILTPPGFWNPDFSPTQKTEDSFAFQL